MKFVVFLFPLILHSPAAPAAPAAPAKAQESKAKMLFTCHVEYKGVAKVEIDFAQKGDRFQMVEGSNMQEPIGVTSIKRPEFKKENGRCLYSYKSFGKSVFVDRDKKQISSDVGVLGDCEFFDETLNCSSVEPEQKPKKSKGITP